MCTSLFNTAAYSIDCDGHKPFINCHESVIAVVDDVVTKRNQRGRCILEVCQVWRCIQDTEKIVCLTWRRHFPTARYSIPSPCDPGVVSGHGALTTVLGPVSSTNRRLRC